jgi:O-antigen ligase
MRKVALFLAFAGPPIAPLERLLYSYGVPEILPYPHLAFCLPALLLGLLDWKRMRTFADSFPLLLCVGLAALSLTWVDESERGRSLLIVASLATGLPISVTVVRLGANRFCACAFIFSSLVSLGLMVWNTDSFSGRLGELIIEEYEFTSNPNAFGGQMAAAAILTVSLLLIDCGPLRHDTRRLFASRSLYFAVAALFYIATVLSASRGSIACLGLVTMIFFFGQELTRNRVICGTAILLVTICALAFASDFADPAVGRFSDHENTATLGGRLLIWTSAVEAMQDSPWIGVGIGGVEKTLADYYRYREGVVIREDGVRQRASHNSYVEWTMAMGVIGFIPGAWLIWRMFRRAVVLDRKCGTVSRRALFAYCCLFSASTTVYRLSYWIPIAALVLAAMAPPTRWRQATNAAARRGIAPHRFRSPVRRPSLAACSSRTVSRHTRF